MWKLKMNSSLPPNTTTSAKAVLDVLSLQKLALLSCRLLTTPWHGPNSIAKFAVV